MDKTTELISTLRALAIPSELPKVRKRLSEDEPAFGLRMRDLFDTAKAYSDMQLSELERLIEHEAYEPRMAAFCILDFKARRRLSAAERDELCAFYVSHHDRITTWDMVDRSAPRVVGQALVGGPYDLLDQLAEADDPLRRRSAITAALYFVRGGTQEDITVGFNLAERLLADPETVVHNAVGIFLKHAGPRNPERFHTILAAGASSMPRSALRLAIEKLDQQQRETYLGLKS